MLKKEDVYKYLRKKLGELKKLVKESGDNIPSQIKKVIDQIRGLRQNAYTYCKDCEIEVADVPEELR